MSRGRLGAFLRTREGFWGAVVTIVAPLGLIVGHTYRECRETDEQKALALEREVERRFAELQASKQQQPPPQNSS